MAIRRTVFVDEQGYSAAVEQHDAYDPLCDHLLMTQVDPDGTTTDIGTLRFYPAKLKLGRVAILAGYRGGGRGKALVDALEEHVRERRGKTADVLRGKKAVQLLAHAQVPSLPFYEKTGWATFGLEFEEEGTPHVKVVKRIELVPECVLSSFSCLALSPCHCSGADPPSRRAQTRNGNARRPPSTRHVPRRVVRDAGRHRPLHPVQDRRLCRRAGLLDGGRARRVRPSPSLLPPSPPPALLLARAHDTDIELAGARRKDPESDHLIMYRVGADGEKEDAGTIRWWPKPGQPEGKPAGKLGRVCGAFALALSGSRARAALVVLDAELVLVRRADGSSPRAQFCPSSAAAARARSS